MSASDPTEPGRHPARAALRFVIAGGLNTAVTGLALAGLATIMDRRAAYTIVFAAGVVLATVLAGRFVYGVPFDRRLSIRYAALYVAVFAVGMAVVQLIERFGLPPWTTGLVVFVTAPLTFVGGLLLTRRATRAGAVR